ncbi:unnamed protein product [Linum trigynum]|uniref:Uncharacterized protein n=1 Tax=Linum trigynum TaxID=586398 RepID=A0AAV2DMJ1_9ROSI
MGGLTGALLYGVGSVMATVDSAMELADGTLKEADSNSCEGTWTFGSLKEAAEVSQCLSFNEVNNGTLIRQRVEGHLARKFGPGRYGRAEEQDVEWMFGIAGELLGSQENQLFVGKSLFHAIIRVHGLHGEPMWDAWSYVGEDEFFETENFGDRSLVQVVERNWKDRKRRLHHCPLIIINNNWEGSSPLGLPCLFSVSSPLLYLRRG